MKVNRWCISCSLLVFLLCFALFVPARMAAGEEQRPQLTLQEALERALRVDHSVRRAELERDKAREEKEKATEQLKDSYVYLTPEYEEDHRRVVLAELNYQMKSGEEEAARNNLETQVIEEYCGVLTALEEVGRAEQALAAGEWEYNAVLARWRNGMSSTIEVEQVVSSVKQSRSALAQTEQDLAKAYIDLNTLIGFQPERRPELVTELPYQPLEIRSITTEVSRALDSSRDLYALGRYVQIQRQELRLFFIDHDIQEFEVKLAELQEAELKSELQKQVRLFYQDILSLEEMIASAAERVKLAEQALHVAQVRYEVGMAARGELIQAEEDLASARHGLAEMQYSHISAAAAYRNLTGREIAPASASL